MLTRLLLGAPFATKPLRTSDGHRFKPTNPRPGTDGVVDRRQEAGPGIDSGFTVPKSAFAVRG